MKEKDALVIPKVFHSHKGVLRANKLINGMFFYYDAVCCCGGYYEFIIVSLLFLSSLEFGDTTEGRLIIHEFAYVRARKHFRTK